jgi:hypothetical protein
MRCMCAVCRPGNGTLRLGAVRPSMLPRAVRRSIPRATGPMTHPPQLKFGHQQTTLFRLHCGIELRHCYGTERSRESAPGEDLLWWLVSDESCLCGAVRLTARGRPYRVGICHCMDCRKPSTPLRCSRKRPSRSRAALPNTRTGTSARLAAGRNGDEIEIHVGCLDGPNR